jgi:hypothetical protein
MMQELRTSSCKVESSSIPGELGLTFVMYWLDHPEILHGNYSSK